MYHEPARQQLIYRLDKLHKQLHKNLNIFQGKVDCMEKKTKTSKRKRSFASSMLSYFLVFAMVLTNVQPAQGALVWAAENETEFASETAAESDSGQADEAQDRKSVV